MLTIDPQTATALDFYQFMIASVAPRPIAFVSTVDDEGNTNLAPYSFFNAFSAKPPILIFSTSRRMRDNSTKDTLSNVESTKECVINIVSHKLAGQMALTSINYPIGTSEFDKAGLTPIPSDLVKAYRVKESPVQFECSVEQILPLGTEGGAGCLIICKILRMHIDEAVLDNEKKRIDPYKIDLIGRLGRSYYTRASGNAIFEMAKAELPIPIGFDNLPDKIIKSSILTGNSIAHIAGLTELPSKETILAVKSDSRVQKILFTNNKIVGLHLLAQEEMQKGNIDLGIKLALLGEFV
jgi:flavin reductase (DIM6/NTAB) family NADH-FMN oxidoreductase RutF